MEHNYRLQRDFIRCYYPPDALEKLTIDPILGCMNMERIYIYFGRRVETRRKEIF
jgi:hypothetical protein